MTKSNFYWIIRANFLGHPVHLSNPLCQMKWKNSFQHRPAGRPWWGFPQPLSRCCSFQIWWRITWFLMLEEFALKTSPHIGNHCWPGPLGLWNKRNCCGLVEVLLLSSRFLFPCLKKKFTRTAEYLPGTLRPTRLQDWHLNLWKVWKATQQRSPWAVPGGHCACASAHKWTALAATSQLRAAAPRRCWKYNTQLPENTKHTTSFIMMSGLSVTWVVDFLK